MLEKDVETREEREVGEGMRWRMVRDLQERGECTFEKGRKAVRPSLPDRWDLRYACIFRRLGWRW